MLHSDREIESEQIKLFSQKQKDRTVHASRGISWLLLTAFFLFGTSLLEAKLGPDETRKLVSLYGCKTDRPIA
jgi:hypothetical protein